MKKLSEFGISKSMFFLLLINRIIDKLIYIFQRMYVSIEKRKLGYCGKRVVIHGFTSLNSGIFIFDDVNIYENCKFIMGPNGKFIMKQRSGAAQNLTVITGKHGKKVGRWSKELMLSREYDAETTITVGEDVRIGANVTLMPGVTIGRGAQIGACTVVTKDIPPYAIAVGNPSRVLRFIFSPNQIIEHEKTLYPINDRFSLEFIESIQKAVN